MNAVADISITSTSKPELQEEQLLCLLEKMQSAFDEQEWQNLAVLDRQCRSVITDLVKSAQPEVVSKLTETLRFYAELVTRCEVSKNQLANQSISLRNSSAQGRVYRSLNVLK